MIGVGHVEITAGMVVAADFVETDQESDLVERLWSLGQRQERIEAALGQVQEHLTRGTEDPDDE